ncbi:MAG: CDP-alcohol phosphatidyltransferase family protein [Hyphomicrobiaceae bacterium]|jgi:phosphatidylglycerophosphate synthase
MIDPYVRLRIDPPLNALGRWLADLGVRADQVTMASFAFGVAAVVAIALGAPLAGLGLILAGRLADGLDGAIARATAKTDRGGFLDITLDFWFYGLVPVGFAILDPGRNGVAAAILVSSFFANGSSFLAFAIMAAKRNIETAAQGQKSLFYMTGLVEGAETIAFFVLFCLFPDYFPWLAGLMAAMCYVSAGVRVVMAYRVLAP